MSARQILTPDLAGPRARSWRSPAGAASGGGAAAAPVQIQGTSPPGSSIGHSLDCSEGGACACTGGAQCVQKERMSTNQSSSAPTVYLVYECEAKK